MKKIQIFTVAAMAILLITSFNQRATINQLNHTVMNQNHQISSINNGLQSIHRSVDNSLANWERENRWLQNGTHSINAISDDGETIEVDVSWQFNELKKDEEVYLMVGENTGSSEYSWEKIKMDPAGDMHFQKTLTLALKGDYKLDVIAENVEGSRLAELGRVDFYRTLRERFQVHGDIRPISTDKAYISVDIFTDSYRYMYAHNQFSPEFISKLEAKSIIVEIYLDDQLVKNIDLLEETTARYHQELEIERGHYPEEFINIHKQLEIEGMNSGKLSALVKITDGLGEVYEYQLH
ncbi:MAG: hypothetical protein JJT76_06165 [Clostridiaceae bacterium]|nr:hypothetical protein [Clostridiaceae bacterium]